MDFNSILACPVVGDASSDSMLIQAADAFVRDSRNSISERAAVVEHLEVRVMGCDSTRSDCYSDVGYVGRYLDS